MLKLLGRKNAFNVRKVLWLLDELGLDFQQEDWGRFHRDTQVPEFLAINPLGKVPVLLDGAAVIRESHVILRYLASRQQAWALYPQDLVARAGVEAWMDWVAYEMTGPMQGAYLGGEQGLEPWCQPHIAGPAREGYKARMVILDQALTSPFLAGDAFTLADIPAGFIVHRWFSMRNIPDRPELPALSAYYERLSARPAFMRHIRNGLP
ncbi:glutathione S-transferase family protein [Rhodovarius crocodyli]|uniref:Glutathione S-transferase family protein n=1 Tax=Rhodovarius crocodyli TaxID=1979269 RepID=A0A437MJ67_9PROT|nr:glutathione S-transferase family protein [Rhodovarius crocodyli]RVT97692.1 glutathione S-transferase family protein [Rhodovarius crocodyli]